MSLVEKLSESKQQVHERWLDLILTMYPKDSMGFFKRERNHFANPVGNTLAEGTLALLDGMLVGHDDAQLHTALMPIIKILAIQDLTPAQAVGFVLHLKQVVREKTHMDEQVSSEELRAFEDRVDHVLLLAVNALSVCREQLFQVRMNDVKRQVSTLMKRSKFFVDDDAPDTKQQQLER